MLNKSSGKQLIIERVYSNQNLLFFCLFIIYSLFIFLTGIKNFPYFNSDTALQIMMAKYFDASATDFYVWGQNRLGSLLPMLLILPIKILKLDPLYSATLLSLFMYLGYIFLLTYFSNSFTEKALILFSLALIPPEIYTLLLYTGHPYTPSLFLLLLVFYFIFEQTNILNNLIGSYFIGIVLGISLWVSEANIAGIAALCLSMFYFGKRSYLLSRRMLWLGTGVLTILLLIGYNRYSIGLDGYNAEYFQIANIEELIWGVKHFISKWVLNLTAVKNSSLIYSLIIILFILIHLIVLVDTFKSSFRKKPTLVVYIALFDIFYSLLILAAKHTYIGEREYERYFTPLTLNSIYLATVMFCEGIRSNNSWGISCLAKKSCYLFIVGALFVNLATTYRDKASLFRYDSYGRERVEALEKLNAKFVYGNYWDSYNLTVLSNFSFLAVPVNFVRGQKFLTLFVKADTVFLLNSIDINSFNYLKKLFTIENTEYPFILKASRKRLN